MVQENELNQAFNASTLTQKMQILLEFPASDFDQLAAAFYQSKPQLDHFFKLDISETGIVCLPIKEDAGLPPAKFCATSASCQFAQILQSLP